MVESPNALDAQIEFWETSQALMYWGMGVSGAVFLALLFFLGWRFRRVKRDANGHYFV